MSNWIVHITLGVILGIICIIFNLGMSQDVLYAAVIATILGSIIPDIDHKRSKVRNLFRWLLLITLLFIVYLTLASYFQIGFDLSILFKENILLLFIVFALSIFISSIIVYIVESLIPKHRGPVHRISASILYALLVYFVANVFGFEQAAVIAFWGFLGYLSHLFMDILI